MLCSEATTKSPNARAVRQEGGQVEIDKEECVGGEEETKRQPSLAAAPRSTAETRPQTRLGHT